MKLISLIRNKIIFVFLIILFSLGFALGLLIGDLPYFSWDKTVSVGEISNLMLTILVAVFLPFYLDKKINSKRIEKDIIIASLSILSRGIKNQSKDIIKFVAFRKKFTKEEADLLLLRVRGVSAELFTIIDSCKSYNNENIKYLLDELKNYQIEYYECITVNLKNKKPCITDDTYIQVDRILRSYVGCIQKTILILNSC